jgi:predicted MFS family arabinose efflux permease
VFVIIAAVMLIPLVGVLGMQEPPDRSPEQAFDWAAFNVMRAPRFVWFGVFALVQSFIQFGIDGLPTFYMAANFAASEAMIGTYGTVRGIGALCGAVLTMVVVTRMGRRRALLLSIALTALFGGAFAAAGSANAVILMGAVWGAVWAFQGTLFVILAMDLCDARIAASMFAIMMGIINLGTAIGEGVGTALTDDIGFANVFLLFAALTVIEVVLAWQLFRTAPQLLTGRRQAEVYAPLTAEEPAP